jgi:hypothetical protein
LKLTATPDHSTTLVDGEREYAVSWTIELTASSPRAAAEAACAIQRDAASTATVFDVRALDEDTSSRVDLAEDDEARPAQSDVGGATQ